MTVHPEDRVAAFVAADPLTVWEMVSDITRMGDWSPECYKAMWLGPKRGKGSVFLGMNKDRGLTWPSPAIVTESEPGKIYAFRAASGVIWRYLVSPEDCGTRLIDGWLRPAYRRPTGGYAHHGRSHQVGCGADRLAAGPKERANA